MKSFEKVIGVMGLVIIGLGAYHYFFSHDPEKDRKDIPAITSILEKKPADPRPSAGIGGSALRIERATQRRTGSLDRETVLLNAPSSPVSLQKLHVKMVASSLGIGRITATILSSRPFQAVHVGVILYDHRRNPTHRLLLEALEPRGPGEFAVKGKVLVSREDEETHLYAVAYVHAVEFDDGTEWRHDPALLQATLLTLRKNGSRGIPTKGNIQ